MINSPFDIPEVKAFFEESKFKSPNEVQTHSWKSLVEGRSGLLLAPTGAGKTLAALLPMLVRLKEMERENGPAESSAPRLVCLAPTKELAGQLLKVLKDLAHHFKFRARGVYGKSRGDQDLFRQNIDVLVTVPGSLVRLKSGLVPAPMLFMDEVDQLMEPSFSKEMGACLKWIEEAPCAQIVAATATLDIDTSERLKELLGAPLAPLYGKDLHKVKKEIATYNIPLVEAEKKLMVREFLSKKKGRSGIIFVNKKEPAEELFNYLKEIMPAKAFYLLHGKLPGDIRRKSLSGFQKNGGVLVATDVAARGLDIAEVAWVLNFDLPFHAVYYLHRVGRTGRGSSTGEAYNFVTSRDAGLIEKINSAIQNQEALTLAPIKGIKKKAQPAKKAAGKKSQGRAAGKNAPKKAKRKPGFVRRRK